MTASDSLWPASSYTRTYQRGAQTATSDTYKDDALELFGPNVAITILVEVRKGLPEALALQSLHELGEFTI